MNYKGKLYGKVGGEYIPLEHTSQDFDELVEALEGILVLIDNKTLVRDTSHDVDSDWAIKQMPLVMGIKRATAALKKAKP